MPSLSLAFPASRCLFASLFSSLAPKPEMVHACLSTRSCEGRYNNELTTVAKAPDRENRFPPSAEKHSACTTALKMKEKRPMNREQKLARNGGQALGEAMNFVTICRA